MCTQRPTTSASGDDFKRIWILHIFFIFLPVVFLTVESEAWEVIKLKSTDVNK